MHVWWRICAEHAWQGCKTSQRLRSINSGHRDARSSSATSQKFSKRDFRPMKEHRGSNKSSLTRNNPQMEASQPENNVVLFLQVGLLKTPGGGVRRSRCVRPNPSNLLSCDTLGFLKQDLKQNKKNLLVWVGLLGLIQVTPGGWCHFFTD